MHVLKEVGATSKRAGMCNKAALQLSIMVIKRARCKQQPVHLPSLGAWHQLLEQVDKGYEHSKTTPRGHPQVGANLTHTNTSDLRLHHTLTACLSASELYRQSTVDGPCPSQSPSHFSRPHVLQWSAAFPWMTTNTPPFSDILLWRKTVVKTTEGKLTPVLTFVTCNNNKSWTVLALAQLLSLLQKIFSVVSTSSGDDLPLGLSGDATSKVIPC